jgi:hypothetical protein
MVDKYIWTYLAIYYLDSKGPYFNDCHSFLIIQTSQIKELIEANWTFIIISKVLHSLSLWKSWKHYKNKYLTNLMIPLTQHEGNNFLFLKRKTKTYFLKNFNHSKTLWELSKGNKKKTKKWMYFKISIGFSLMSKLPRDYYISENK